MFPKINVLVIVASKVKVGESLYNLE